MRLTGAGPRADIAWSERLFVARARAIPVVSTLAGSLAQLLPIVAPVPVLPPMGLMMALGWRLLRPELWQAWIALPLGLADDLIGGAPLGSAMAGWTLCFLAFDLIDHRLPWRGYVAEWTLAALGLAVCTATAWGFAHAAGGGDALPTMLPPLVLAILAFPAAQRLCAALDTRRLRR